MSTAAPASCASDTISATGLMVPSAFESWVMATSRVRGPTSPRNSSILSAPASSIGATRRRAPTDSHSICHGTMFEWCSMADSRTSSPGPTRRRPNACATRLMPSVAFRVKMISRGPAAFRNRATVPRARSNPAVARSLSVWTPRCTLALDVS